MPQRRADAPGRFPFSHHRPHDHPQHDDEERSTNHARCDQMQRVQLRRIVLQIRPPPHAEERPEHRLH
jgi:hypothetical protein